MAEPTVKRGRRGTGRILLEAIGFLFLAYLAYTLVAGAFLSGPETVSGPDGALYAAGPEEARNAKLIVAPGVSVELLPSAAALAEARFDRFDVSDRGVVLVGHNNRIVDMLSNDPLLEGNNEIRSFGFVGGGGLAMVDEAGMLGVYDGGKFRPVGPAPIPAAVLTPSSDRTRLFLHREDGDGSGESPAIVAVGNERRPQILTGSFTPILAVGGDAFQTYYADGNSLFQILAPGKPNLVLTLPEPTQNILGIAVGGGAVYFATSHAVYLVDGDVVIPIVIGIGGDLRIRGSDLYVLAAEFGRVYRIHVADTPQ